MSKKKILIIGPAHPLRGGGITTFNERLCKELMNLGHECHILSFSLQYPSFLFPGKTQYSTDEAPEGLTIFTEINSINPLNWLKVGLKYKKAGYDIVIFRYWLSFMAPALGTIARLIRSNNKTKTIALTDNVIPHEQRFFDTPFTKYFLKSCDGFLTMSQSVKSDLARFEPNKPALYAPHPLYDNFGDAVSKQTAKQQLALNANDNYLLFFGFIRQYKGLQLLIEAMADERLKQLNIKLIIAGEFYENKNTYIDLITSLNLINRIVLSNDFIPNNQVVNYFCAADLVVQPYLHATQSGVTQIAYYYNKPMVVTNVGGLSELIPNGKVGYVTEVSSIAIADAVYNFYTQQKEVEFAANINHEKKRFTWQNLCNSLLQLATNEQQ